MFIEHSFRASYREKLGEQTERAVNFSKSTQFGEQNLAGAEEMFDFVHKLIESYLNLFLDQQTAVAVAQMSQAVAVAQMS